MKFLRRFLIRLSNFAARRSADQRLQEEIAEHLAFQTEENVRAGMSSAEARRQAALKLGAAEAIREQHHAEQSLPFIENLLIDLRYAVRVLLRSPGFAFIAIATMALGVGATTAIYSVIDATLLHPLPYPNPTELIHVEDDLPGIGAQDVGISIPEWRDLREFRDIPVRVDCRPRRKREPHRRLHSPSVSASSVSRRITSRSSVSAPSWVAHSIRTMPLPASTCRS